jgi:hypothetical protein
MESSPEQLRRDLRDLRRDEAEAHRAAHDLLARVLDDPTVPPAERARLLGGALARRRFLQLGGLSVASAAVLAACGGPGEQGSVPIAGTSPATTKAPERVVTDATYLRTASSLELSVVDAYDRAIALGVLPAELNDAARTFRDQHEEHAGLFAELTRDADGTPFEEPNPVVQAAIIDPAFTMAEEAGNAPADLVSIIFGLETLAAETYQQYTPLLVEPRLRAGIMSVGGTEARHAAIVARVMPDYLVVPAPVDATAVTTTTAAGPTTTVPDVGGPAEVAPTYQVPGAFQPLTSVQITIGIETINVDPLGPNSYMYEYNI